MKLHSRMKVAVLGSGYYGECQGIEISGGAEIPALGTVKSRIWGKHRKIDKIKIA